MTKIFPVEVGQTVYVGVFRGLAATMPAEQMLVGTVSKIGRKVYVYRHRQQKHCDPKKPPSTLYRQKQMPTIPSTSCFGLKKIMPLKC